MKVDWICLSQDDLRPIKHLCRTGYCCPLCPEDVVKPGKPARIKMHLMTVHWKSRVEFQGYFLVRCGYKCEPNATVSSSKRYWHYHCPICPFRAKMKEKFTKHLSKKHPSPININPDYKPDQKSQWANFLSSKTILQDVGVQTDKNDIHTNCLEGIPIKLPSGFTYLILAEEHGDGDNYTLRLQTNIASKDDIFNWIKQYNEETKITMKLGQTYPGSQKLRFRCQHNTRNKQKEEKRATKNTSCPASIIAVISDDPVLQSLNTTTRSTTTNSCSLLIKFCHNHPLDDNILKFRPVSTDILNKLNKMFSDGYRPSFALHLHRFDLQIEHGERYPKILADRYFCPTVDNCQHFHKMYFKNQRDHSEKSGFNNTSNENLNNSNEIYEKQVRNNMTMNNEKEHLKSLAASYNAEHDEEGGKIVVYYEMEQEAIHPYVAICTPIMARIHRLVRESGEVCFCDSTKGIDRFHCRLILLLVRSAVGSLPLAVGITSNKSKASWLTLFNLIKETLPNWAFYGRGTQGPWYFVSDDNDSLQSALHSVWSNSELFLSDLLIRQSMWRWLWLDTDRIHKQDRPMLMNYLIRLLYAENEQALDVTYSYIINDPCVQKYINFRNYLEDLWTRRRQWALCYRKHIPLPSLQGTTITDLVESVSKDLKGNILGPFKAFSVVHLVDFVINRMEDYFHKKLIDSAHNRITSLIAAKISELKNITSLQDIIQISPSVFEIPDNRKMGYTYAVDTELWICSCNVGQNGALCKHQIAVAQKYNILGLHVPMLMPEQRHLFYTIATGEEFFLDMWLQPVNNCEEMDQSMDNTANDDGVSEGIHSPYNPPVAVSDMTRHYEYLKQQLDIMYGNICEKMKKDETYFPAVKAFLSAFNTMKSDSEILEALYSFGKCNSIHQ